MKHLLATVLLCLTLAACGNCEVKASNDHGKGLCSVFNTGF